jgi:hypothetical protein
MSFAQRRRDDGEQKQGEKLQESGKKEITEE